MNAIVLGASGLVGSHVLEEGMRRGIAVTGTSRDRASTLTHLDVTDSVQLRDVLVRTRPDVVILAAALANVDRCEQEPGETARVNVAAPRAVASACSEIGARLVFYSSDYVFDGTAGPYGEGDPPRPLGVYGSQKLTAEREIRDILPTAHLILRTTVVYGTESAGKNFLIRLVQNLRSQTPIRVPYDQVGSPTLVDDLAVATWQLIAAGTNGVVNVAGPERMDRHAFARLAARTFRLDPGPIVGVSTAELNQVAPRPLDAGLRVDKAEAILGRSLVGASEGLARIARSLSP